MVSGLIRISMTSREGRQVTIRYEPLKRILEETRRIV
jgi:hypothetical protein